MRTPTPLRFPRRRASTLLAALVGCVGLVLATSPASAQYGGSPQLIVDPVRVPIDGDFDAFGQDCPGASTVTITIDGFSTVLATGIAGDDSVFSIPAVPMPAGVVAGTDYSVRAACAGDSVTFVITAVCNDGTDPIGGECASGNTTGGGGTAGTTTTTPGGGGGSSTTIPGGGGGGTTGGGGGSGGTTGGGGGGSGSTNLAVTGTDTLELAAMVGTTLIAAGFGLMLIAGRRRRVDDAG